MNEPQEDKAGPPLVEAYPVEDKYVDGIGRVEVTGHNVRFVFYTGRPKDGGEYDREIATRVVMPMEQVMPLLTMIVSTPRIFGSLDASQIFKAVSVFGLIH
ncbi:hypothetical protein BRAS3843_1480037 [Bradyrhizobium sp. STM 3843]|uniref:hypothetical protein n=1 Tax=Bradyrhizobium sp. STM 3843 TaxID=551947 RepID=UPI0002406BB0|nr:hypothetical protein [Bradyrhizobium sp. STM 3843]CCE05806.1 hypothetical protein BRAS3843_1480037 [Bradyrhizobium sp. STM 3843]